MTIRPCPPRPPLSTLVHPVHPAPPLAHPRVVTHNAPRMSDYPKIGSYKRAESLRARLAELQLDLPVDDSVLTAGQGSPLAQPLTIGGFRVGNRWCVQPMEGWDGGRDGSPSEHTLRRWRRFGASGAKLIWGGEAAAVVPEGRANPRQIQATRRNLDGLRRLLDTLLASHRESFGGTGDLLAGLQLTHSGRFCRPHSKKLEPRIAYHHPLLDGKFGIDPNDDSVIMTDSEAERLIDDYISAAGVARDAGFQFVDIKACHGYLFHEFLGAETRPGRFGGDFEGRSRLLVDTILRVREAWPDLMVFVRLSAYDTVPFQTGVDTGQPMEFQHLLPYRFGFGLDRNNPLRVDFGESLRLIGVLRDIGVAAINITCGSPYYSPHLQRPAIFPPSDGYKPPEDPLAGVARQIQATRACKRAFPDIPIVGSGYSYLQDYLPHVAQAVIREGWSDCVGLGRMILSYPRLPADTLATGKLARGQVCRTFSDCTTAPRNGMVSGCYPLDPHYKGLPEANRLRRLKRH